MEIKLRKWTDSEGVQHLSVDVPEADDYLDLVRGGMSRHTWVNYAHDLKFFLVGLEKPLAEVRPNDIFDFIRARSRASLRSTSGRIRNEAGKSVDLRSSPADYFVGWRCRVS
jgi:hypothetical protein